MRPVIEGNTPVVDTQSGNNPFLEATMPKISAAPEQESIPFGQRLLDSPFWLLLIGMVVMLGFYTIWGWIEIGTLPPSTLP